MMTMLIKPQMCRMENEWNRFINLTFDVTKLVKLTNLFSADHAHQINLL